MCLHPHLHLGKDWCIIIITTNATDLYKLNWHIKNDTASAIIDNTNLSYCRNAV